MYYYAVCGYFAYTLCKYSKLLDYAIYTGKGIKFIYETTHSLVKQPESRQDKYVDWILIMDE